MESPFGIVEYLRNLAERQNLVQRTIDAMHSRWRDADEEEVAWAFTLDEVQPEFSAQMLCFRSGPRNVDAPYIATNVQLYVFGWHVGYHELLTTLDGDVVQEYGTIYSNYFEEGRAAVLIARARERGEDDPTEWVGLVGLLSTPGNNFFPQDAIGGFVTVLALARDEDEYRALVETYFEGLGVEVEEFDDVGPLSERLNTHFSIDDETLALAIDLSSNEPVAHASTIATYYSEDEEDD